jgi:hypothetical protein
MASKTTGASMLAGLFALIAIACSSSEEGDFFEDSPAGGSGGGAGSAASGGASGSGGSGAAGSGGAGGTGSGFPPVTDFAAPGPFETTSGGEGPQCTIFRPATLGDGGLRHPVIVWGNGTFTSPTTYAEVLTHWASHGFIVAAANTSNAGTGEAMKACLDYVLAQDAQAGAYQGKVDAAHIGTSGHSQGGGGSIMLGTDPRVTVTAPLQPYVAGLGHDSSSQSNQAGPMFLMSGSADSIAAPAINQQPVYNNANVPVFWGTLVGADHLASATGNISGYRGPATAWFRLHLMGDERARSLFYGADCLLCADSAWTVQRKSID